MAKYSVNHIERKIILTKEFASNAKRLVRVETLESIGIENLMNDRDSSVLSSSDSIADTRVQWSFIGSASSKYSPDASLPGILISYSMSSRCRMKRSVVTPRFLSRFVIASFSAARFLNPENWNPTLYGNTKRVV